MFTAAEMEVTGSKDEPRTEFIYCYGANTELLKFGSCRLQPGHKNLILIIPGVFYINLPFVKKKPKTITIDLLLYPMDREKQAQLSSY